jgi:hypothetical protein
MTFRRRSTSGEKKCNKTESSEIRMGTVNEFRGTGQWDRSEWMTG